MSDELDDCVNPLIDEINSSNNIAKRLWQIEMCDEYTYDHSVQVCMLSALIGKWLGLTEDAIKEVSKAGLLHDIGKINIPDEILNKPDVLDDEEFKIMKTHPTLGYVLLMNNKGLQKIFYKVFCNIMKDMMEKGTRVVLKQKRLISMHV